MLKIKMIQLKLLYFFSHRMSSKNAKKGKNMNSTPCAKQSVFKNVANQKNKSIEFFLKKEYNKNGN